MSTVLLPRTGSSVSTPETAAGGERLLTVADVAVLPRELPTGPVDYELRDGRLVIMAPTGDVHGSSQTRLGGELYYQGEKRGFGSAYSETGVILGRNPDRLVGPDNCFVMKSSLPLRTSPEGYLETIPELVVEIRSKNDSPAALEVKVADYLRAGVKVVWLVDPLAKTVAVCRAGEEAAVVLGEAETLTAEEIIPGFRLPLAELFRE